VLGLCALAGMGSGAFAVVSSRESTPEAAAAAEPATPVFSLRRVAGAVFRTVAAANLGIALDGWLAGAEDACVSVRDPDGRVIYQQGAGKALIPASNMKVLTAAVALTRIGPDFRYTTPVRAASAPGPDGSVGDLWLVGVGDPLLATAEFAAIAGWLERPRQATPLEGLADRLVDAGVRRVGRLLGDESRYDAVRYVPSWAPHYATDPQIGPQSALQLNGGFTRWRPGFVAQTRPATDAAGVLAGLLRARGVAVGGVGEGRAPEGGVALAQIESPTMADVVGVMLRESDNLVAELVVKELGARFGSGGTTAAGLAVERAVAAEMGWPVEALTASDGSGLDRGNRLSCGLVDAVLASSGGAGGPLGKGMAAAGATGTLVARFLNSPADGKVKAKTGSLGGVTSLSGWAADQRGGQLQFAMLANGVATEAAGFGVQNRLVNVLVGYPQAPPPVSLEPRPIRPPPG